MSDKLLTKDKQPAPLLTALPPLLFGLAQTLFVLSYVPLSKLVWGGATPLRTLQSQPTLPVWVPGLLLCPALAVGAGLGLVRRLPRWSHTWTSSVVVGLSFLLMIFGDDRPYVVSPAADVAFALAVTFSSVAGPMLRADVALWTAPAGLAFALLLAAFQRGGKAVQWLALLGTGVLAVALIAQYRAVVRLALGSPYDLNFFRVLLGIAMIGLLSPAILSWLLGRRWLPQPRAS